MAILRRVFAILVALAVALLLATAAAAQQPSPGQHHGGAMRAQPMPQNMTPSQRMMHDADKMMANASTMMRDLSVMHTGPHATQHHQAMSSLEAMLGHMRQVHGDLQKMLHDPALHRNHDSIKHFEEACQDLRNMASSFESMTKNMTKAMKGVPGGKK